MFNLFRLASMTLGLIVVVLSAALQQSELRKDLSLDSVNLGCGTEDSTSTQYHFANPRSLVLMKRRELKEKVVQDLLAGRISLFEAAAAFRSVEQQFQDRDNCALRYPDLSPEERFCRMVINWVDAQLSSRPLGDGALVARLEKDLREHKERHGRVVLPDTVKDEYLFQAAEDAECRP